MRVLITAVLLGAAAATSAQIRLPAPLPSLQVPGLLQSGPGPVVPFDSGTRAFEALRDARRAAVARLIRTNRRLVEADPDGEAIVRGEILAAAADDAAISRWAARGFSVLRAQALSTTDVRLVVLQAPANTSTRRALRELRDADPRGVYDFDHIYLESGAVPASTATALPAPNSAAGAVQAARVGLLDTGVDATHPAFRDAEIRTWGCAGKSVPDFHGTAVASLLAAHGAAQIYAADVYCGAPTGGSADLIVAALGWMADENVAVINVSLVGPRNLLLERAVAALIARGHLIVAAVGNDGPAAPPLYPAAYPDVVGVTAVDAQRRVLIEAERGPQVTFAALGADVKAAGTGHDYLAVRGTSFAAPTVAALLAGMVQTPSRQSSLDAVAALAAQAIDLGPPGRDMTYGFGLVGAQPAR